MNGLFGVACCFHNSCTKNQPEPEPISYDTVNFTYVSQTVNMNAHQGVANDENYLYTTDTDGVYKYTKEGTLVSSRVLIDDVAEYPHCGGLLYYNGLLYIGKGIYTDPNSLMTGCVLVLNASDLSFNKIISTFNNHEATSIGIHPDGTFWIQSYSGLPDNYVYKYSSDFEYIGKYHLVDMLNDTYGYDGTQWLDQNTLLANMHEGTGNYCDMYRFDGTTFTRIQRINNTFNGYQCGQGISLDYTDSNYMYWCAREDNQKVYRTLIEKS